jgi:glucose-1-phosphate thymidylyltransferase
MWGIIPAAGEGSRIQPLAFSKELLPVGARQEGASQRPKAVSEYVVERLIRGGATKICFIISPRKSDILRYYGEKIDSVDIVYVVQQHPAGLCDALFRAALLVQEEHVLIGLPDTIWFPADGLARIPDGLFSFLLFPVDHPELFDAVRLGKNARVLSVQVKSPVADSPWIWGAIKMSGRIFHDLNRLWLEREKADQFIGTLINAWIAKGGEAYGYREGTAYFDVGTLQGYCEAIHILRDSTARTSRL